jgi:hypothetical protein
MWTTGKCGRGVGSSWAARWECARERSKTEPATVELVSRYGPGATALDAVHLVATTRSTRTTLTQRSYRKTCFACQLSTDSFGVPHWPAAVCSTQTAMRLRGCCDCPQSANSGRCRRYPRPERFRFDLIDLFLTNNSKVVHEPTLPQLYSRVAWLHFTFSSSSICWRVSCFK